MKGIQITINQEVKTISFADDQLITAEHETLTQMPI
jgi:hypothetical protein